MEYIMHFFKDIYDINVMILFLISAYILAFIDSKNLKKKGLKRDGKFSKVMGIMYAALGIGLYIISLIITS